jgi:hypothetical protein
LNPGVTHSLKPPGFNPCSYEVRKTGFKVCSFKFNLCRYTASKVASRAPTPAPSRSSSVSAPAPAGDRTADLPVPAPAPTGFSAAFTDSIEASSALLGLVVGLCRSNQVDP